MVFLQEKSAINSLNLFDQYVYPNGNISFGATKVTSITKSPEKLICHRLGLNVGLNRFGLCLKELCVVLVGHNIWAFDVKHFWNNVKNNIWRISFALAGSVNPVSLFGNLFPFTKIAYVAHKSMEDFIALSLILKEVNVTKTIIQPFFKCLSFCLSFLLEKKWNLATLQHLLTCRVISKGMNEEIKSGLCY